MSYILPTHMPLETKWRHYPTYIYDRNYSYGMNYYQPMIDYIDIKQRIPRSTLSKFEIKKLPELPWSDGKILWENKKVQLYTKDNLIKNAINAEDNARNHLSHFKIASRSDFSLAKTVYASRVTKDILPWMEENLKRLSMPLIFASARARSETKQIQKMNQETISNIKLQALKDVQVMNEERSVLEHNKNLRGKSAKAIEFQLMTETLKNLSKSQELADIRKFQKETVHTFWDDKTYGRRIDDKTKALLDEDKLIQPLNTLSKELRGYEQKSNNYFKDKRYRDWTRQKLLYKCRGCEYYVKRS